jgi:Dolichyl-phosphate-mannose-protein mannosyltransferase
MRSHTQTISPSVWPISEACPPSHVRWWAHAQTAQTAQTGRVHDAPGIPKDTAITRRWEWARHVEFWLALALAAYTRLWHLELTQYLDDQTGLMTLARMGITRHALPLTGIPSSIGTLNPPFSVYLLMPFAIAGPDPFPAVVALALWNIAAVALCYIFALRYFGRVVAASGTLLFATGATAVNFSRFLWQQNYLPTVVALWALTLYAGCIQGRRNWFVPHALLLAAGILLHPTAALLLPATLVGVLLAPRPARRREFLVLGVVVLLLLVPTLIYEAVSQGSDLRILGHFAKSKGHFDLGIFYAVSDALSGPPSIVVWFSVLTGAILALVFIGYVRLSFHVFSPLRHHWSDPVSQASAHERLQGFALRVWDGLCRDRGWRIHLLLWLWFTVPIVALLRHSSPVYAHYLYVVYPVGFIVAGLGAHTLFELTHALTRRWRAGAIASFGGIASRALLVVLLGLLIAGETARSVQGVSELAAGNFVAYQFYGYPLAELQAADAQIAAIQREQHASSTYLSLPLAARYRAPMDYMLVGEHQDRVSSSYQCLLLPAAQSSPSLVVSTVATTPAQALLATLPNARKVADIPLAGGSPFPVYRVDGATPLLADETPLRQMTYRNSNGVALQLDAATFATPQLVRLRWTIQQAPVATDSQPWFRFTLGLPDNAGQTAATARVNCDPSGVKAGDTLFTWIQLASSLAVGDHRSITQLLSTDALTLHAFAGTHMPDMPSIGPFRFLADKDAGQPLSPLEPVTAFTSSSEETPTVAP